MGIRRASLFFRAMARYHITLALAWRKVVKSTVRVSYGAKTNTKPQASSGIGICSTKTNTDALRKLTRQTNARTSRISDESLFFRAKKKTE